MSGFYLAKIITILNSCKNQEQVDVFVNWVYNIKEVQGFGHYQFDYILDCVLNKESQLKREG